MELEPILALLNEYRFLPFVVTLVAAMCLVVLLFLRQKKRFQTAQDNLERRVDTLWREMDEVRVQQFDGTAPVKKDPEGGLERAQFMVEKDVFEKLWPQVSELHDKLGVFLRTVESGEPPAASRVSARNAALNARATVNALRPFFDEEMDDLLSRFIDVEIKAHLAACQYMDKPQAGAEEERTDSRESDAYRQKFRLLYDGEARDLLGQLVGAMRRRMVRPLP